MIPEPDAVAETQIYALDRNAQQIVESYRKEQAALLEAMRSKENSHYIDEFNRDTEYASTSNHNGMLALVSIEKSAISLHRALDLKETDTTDLSSPSQKLIQSNQKFAVSCKKLGVMSGLILAGIAVTAGTMGHAAVSGTALIAEGINGMQEVFEDPKKEKNIEKLLSKINAEQDSLTDEIVTKWAEEVINYCQSQQKNLGEQTQRDETADKIGALKTQYQESLDKLEKIKNEPDPSSKKNALIVEVKEISDKEKNIPIDILSAAKNTHWKDTAKKFYQRHKKVINFIGLIGLAAAGIGLSLVTGGVAAAFGGAALGIVGLTCAKQLIPEMVSNNFITMRGTAKDTNQSGLFTYIFERKKQITIHCDQQISKIKSIKKSLPEYNFSTVNRSLKDDCERYEKHKQDVVAVSDKTSPAQQIHKLDDIGRNVELTNELASRAIMLAGDITLKVKKTTTAFQQAAKNFQKDNKKTIQNIAQCTLATAALAGLAVTTGGIGFIAAAGFAVMAWGISSLTQKAIAHIKKANNPVDDENEKEGIGEKKVDEPEARECR